MSCRLVSRVLSPVGLANRDDSVGMMPLTRGVQVPPPTRREPPFDGGPCRVWDLVGRNLAGKRLRVALIYPPSLVRPLPHLAVQPRSGSLRLGSDPDVLRPRTGRETSRNTAKQREVVINELPGG